MRADGRTTARARIVRRWLLMSLAVVVLGGLVSPSAVAETDPRVQEAERLSADALARLEQLLGQIEGIEREAGGVNGRLEELRAQAAQEEARVNEAAGDSSERVRTLYMHRTTDPGLALLTSGSAEDAAERTRLLEFLTGRSQSQGEIAGGSRQRIQLELSDVEGSIPELEAQLAQLQALRAQADAAVQQANAELERIRQRVAAESQGGFAPVRGGIACPVGEPNTFSDTWGAPRSGGRRHQGTDILAAQGIPIYAFESGTITRMNSNSLGGTSLYLRGDSGNLYYYTHLSSYASGISVGDRVEAGQLVARNGMTGNAPVPHLHFEVMPGGGQNVNPYPFVRQACG